MFRPWQVIVGSIALAGLLYALYPHTTGVARPGTTEITIWFNGPIEGRQIDVVDAFERKFPQYRVVLGSSAVRTGLDGEGNPQRLMCGIAGGVPPEIVEYDRFAICQWAARDAFLDLTPLIQRDAPSDAGATGDPYAVRSDDYYPATWNECVYRGGVYGIPNYMDDRVLYVNDDMLVRAGFADERGEPRPPRSWEEVIRKRIDTRDAEIAGDTVRSATADFIAAGVKPGDTLSHISQRGQVTRCVVASVVSLHELKVRSPYARRDLALTAGRGQHVKIFDAECYALRLTRWDDSGAIKVVGFEPQHGNAWLYLYGWSNGGEFLSADGRTCTLDDPRIAAALHFTTDIYDALGGSDQVNAFKKSFQTAAQDPFLMNQIAMFIQGDWFIRDIARYQRDMRFTTAAPPVPQRQIDAGHSQITWVAGFAYCIPASCPKEKLDAAWALVKFLSSVEGGMIMNEHDAQRARVQGRLYVPRLMANRKLNDAQIARYIDRPEMNERLRRAIRTHLDLLPVGRFRPVSPEGQKLWNAQADAQDLAWSHTMAPEEILARQTQRVQRSLDRFYHQPADARPVDWMPFVWAYLGATVLVGFAAWVHHRRRKDIESIRRREARAAVAFMLPWLVGFLVLSGGPMVFSGIMSFTEYDVIAPARWVGLDNYREMFTVDWGGPNAEGKETVPTGVRRALLNTTYMAIGLPLGMIVGLGLAMLLDSGVRGMRAYRTFFFLPAIMPVVAASILWIWIFNAQNGLLNGVLRVFGIEQLIAWLSAQTDWINLRTPISWLTSRQTSKPALILMGLWGAGSSMIVWLAGLKSIPEHLYEAAAIDGAGPVRRFYRVTLPMLSPYILFNLIIGLIGTFQIFTQAYIMTPNGYPERSTYFYVYKLFDECFSFFRLGYGSAMAWVLFAIVIVLTLINMRLSKKWVHYAGE